MTNKKTIQYDALSVAKYLLSLDPNREYFGNKKMPNRSIIKGNFRLNQMLYLLQIFYHLKQKKTLFSDNLYAWENGVIVYSVYTRFWELYLQKNGQDTNAIAKEDQKTIATCFRYLKDIPDRVLQEFAYHDPAWSSTWAKSSQPEINFSGRENLETYRQFCSRWLPEATRL
ncbi:Conserved protein of unknown function (DUF4065) [endosymbiont DhMRE of Dentiscutata heterogama]|uniref:hypothetical protein n=1 Tax=endosymbiont DhMRE of Dentiscutata heterogama TaxID=1609546 RepID=UPI000629D2F3|nr:hypothetical protein [endosymbiont DhMRE of Dentiscutata heterogama]CFW93346.1 Conserved protein of unknown function (DUF4065) [endosymbiont DhMRE of Dentiscutata heterogama]